MSRKKNEIPVDNNMVDVLLEEAMPENFLPYAVEVAKDRALPDVRDGLKPVHRRILYGAYLLKALPDKPYFKSARIVGDILGKFHPHGDSSVYDAMVIMAQNFATREPLFDGHGNFGSMDGDSAAAMRYTEARLSNIAMELLRDIDKNTVDFTPNYSDTELEPTVLSARYPNLLVNGSFGIAVGLATNIPPHNLGEVIDGTCAYIDNNEITTKELMKYIKAPDLPTGGEIIGKSSLLSAYETGVGKVVLRAKTSIETLENGRLAIVIHEFPYKENKAAILQSISEMTGDEKHKKNLRDISDIRDESDRNGVRAVIEFKKSATPDIVEKHLKYLLKKSNLQKNLSFNMVALANKKPETLSLKSMIAYYVEHQKEVVSRRTQYELDAAQKRFHIVEGFIKAISIMDDLVKVIRASKSKKDSKDNIMKTFGFTDEQAEAIVTLMLYRLTTLEIASFEKEYKSLAREIKRLQKILSNEKSLLNLIKEELMDIKERFGNPRKTAIVEDEKEAVINIEEMIIDEEVVITLSKEGFIKRLPQKTYLRSNFNADDIEYREGDYCEFVFNSNTKNDLVAFTESGQMFRTKVINIPEQKWKEKGVRISEIITSLDYEKEKIVNILEINDFEDSKKVVFITKQGNIKVTSFDKFKTNYAKSMATKLKSGDEVIGCYVVSKDSHKLKFHIETEKGFVFVCDEPEISLADKNILPTQFINMLDGDLIKEIGLFEGEVESKCMLSINSDFVVKTGVGKEYSKDDYIVVGDNSGNIYTISVNTIMSVNELNLKSVFNFEIISATFVKKEDVPRSCIYFITEKGMIKKVKSEDIVNAPLNQCCKLKDGDKIVNISVGVNDESKIIMVSSKGKVLRFSDNSFVSTGKAAGTIVGMKLKDDDFVKIGYIESEINPYEFLVKGKKSFDIDSIHEKNKGTMGINFEYKINDVIVK